MPNGLTYRCFVKQEHFRSLCTQTDQFLCKQSPLSLSMLCTSCRCFHHEFASLKPNVVSLEESAQSRLSQRKSKLVSNNIASGTQRQESVLLQVIEQIGLHIIRNIEWWTTLPFKRSDMSKLQILVPDVLLGLNSHASQQPHVLPSHV